MTNLKKLTFVTNTKDTSFFCYITDQDMDGNITPFYACAFSNNLVLMIEMGLNFCICIIYQNEVLCCTVLAVEIFK